MQYPGQDCGMICRVKFLLKKKERKRLGRKSESGGFIEEQFEGDKL